MGLDWYYCPICGEMRTRDWDQPFGSHYSACKHLDEYWKYFDKEYTNDKTFNEFCESEYNYKTFIPLTDEEEKFILENTTSCTLNDEWYHEYHTFCSVNLNELLRDFRLYGENTLNDFKNF